MKRKLWVAVLSAIAGTLTGCGTLFYSTDQAIVVETADQAGTVYRNALCEFQNPSGQSQGISGETVRVRRDRQDMQVRCSAQGFPDATGVLRSRGNMGMAGNLASGNTLGMFLDLHKGTGFSYPERVRLVFGQERFYDRSESQKGVVLLGVDTKAQAAPEQASQLTWTATNFAPIQDSSKVPGLPADGMLDYQSWLDWMPPKAFATSGDGAWYAAHGASPDPTVPSQPAARALELCNRRSNGAGCRLYAVDNTVVWNPSLAAAIGTHASGSPAASAGAIRNR